MNKKVLLSKIPLLVIGLLISLTSCEKNNDISKENEGSKVGVSGTDSTSIRKKGQLVPSALGCDVFAGNFAPNFCGWPNKWYNIIVQKQQQSTILTVDQTNTGSFGADFSINFPFGISSKNGRFTLIGQTDGNLVLKDNSNGKILWAAGSNAKYGTKYPYRLSFHGDGNLVIYAGIYGNGIYDNVVWATDNLSIPSTDYFAAVARNSFYLLQDDGNLVLYRTLGTVSGNYADPNFRNHPVAETGTSNGKVSSHIGAIK